MEDPHQQYLQDEKEKREDKNHYVRHYSDEELMAYVKKCNNPEPEVLNTFKFGSLFNDGELKYIGRAKGKEHCHLLWDIKEEIVKIYEIK